MQRISLGKGCHFKSTAIHEVGFMSDGAFQKQFPVYVCLTSKWFTRSVVRNSHYQRRI